MLSLLYLDSDPGKSLSDKRFSYVFQTTLCLLTGGKALKEYLTENAPTSTVSLTMFETISYHLTEPLGEIQSFGVSGADGRKIVKPGFLSCVSVFTVQTRMQILKS